MNFVWFSIVLHLVGAVALALSWHNWPIVIAVLIGDHLLLLWGSLWPRSRLVGGNVRRLEELGVRGSWVALTFDDGPDPDVTPAVLEILERHGAQATFFCIGRLAEGHPELTRRIAAAGHTLENHTYGHPNSFSFFPPWAQARQIDRAQEEIHRCTGREPRYFRAPAGMRNPWLGFVLKRRGLKLVSWTRRAFDTRNPDPRQVARRLLDSVAAGDILLLHDGSSARDAEGKPVVLPALEHLLAELTDRKLDVRGLPRADGPA